MIRIKQQKDSTRGEVLVEAIIALSILMAGMGGLFALISNSIGLSRSNTDQFIANHLAIEGIELVKYMLEQNRHLGKSDWLDQIDKPPHCYEFDYQVNHERNGLSRSSPYIRNCQNFIDDQSGYQYLVFRDSTAGGPPGYTYDTRTNANYLTSIFKRVVAINAVGGINIAPPLDQSGCTSPPSGFPGRYNCMIRITSSVSWVTRGGAKKNVLLEAVYFDWERQCADWIDNDGDFLIDSVDPGCHTDGNASNPASYEPFLNQE